MRNIHPSISCQIHPSISTRPEAPRGGTHAGARTGPLERYKKSAAAFGGLLAQPRGLTVDFFNEQTGEFEIWKFNPKTGVITEDNFDAEKYGLDRRRENYRLRNLAREWLQDTETPKGHYFAIHYCQRLIAQRGQGVGVKKAEKRAYYGNLVVCGSPWVCPVCSDKISKARELEILEAIDKHTSSGSGLCYMLTLTFAHTRQDDLYKLIRSFRLALSWLRSHRIYKQAFKDQGFTGSIRALETTWGNNNGWHPHTHDLLFLDRPFSALGKKLFCNKIFPVWKQACKKFGLGIPTRKHGIKLTATINVAEYIAKFGHDRKWGPGKELTRAMTKKGSSDFIGDRYTPFDLLRDSDNADRNCRLFCEYAKAFYGSRQLFWSKGLKAHFNIGDKSDQEIAEEHPNEATLIYLIPDAVWYKLLKNKDIRLEILEAAEKGGKSLIHEVITRYIDKISSN